MIRSLSEMIILLSISILAAFTFNFINSGGIPLFGQWDSAKGLVHAGGLCAPAINQTNDMDVMDYYLRSEALFVDARSKSEFVAGHIPGAINLPVGEIDDQIDDFLDNHQPDTRILVYCSGPDCHDSYDLAKILEEYAFKDVSVYYHGFNGWKNAGRPVEVMETTGNE